MKIKFVTCVLIMMLSVPPAIMMLSMPPAKILATDGTSENEKYNSDSNLDLFLNQDVFHLDENIEENYTIEDNSVENDIESELKNEEFEIVEINNLEETQEVIDVNEPYIDSKDDSTDKLRWSISGTTLTLYGGSFYRIDDTLGNLAPWYQDAKNIETVNIEGPVYPIYNMLSSNIEGFQHKSFTGMFSGFSRLTTINGLQNLQLSEARDLSNFFKGCESLKNIELANYFMNARNVTNMKGMFSNCKSLTSLTFTAFSISSVTNMASMFENCSSLTSISFWEAWVDTSKVTDMSSMFYGCSSLTSLDFLSNFVTDKVTDMNNMFRDCSELTSLNIPSVFNTKNVINMSGMFRGCSGLTSISLLDDSFNTSKVTNMSNMFEGCYGLTSLTLPNYFDTSNVTNMSAMFKGSSGLTSLIFPWYFNTGNVTSMNDMFNGCSSISQLDLGWFDTHKVSQLNNMFYNCNVLTTLKLGSNFKSILGTNLPTFTVSNDYIGLWKGRDTKTTFISSTDFMESYTVELADSYTWTVYTDLSRHAMTIKDQVYSGIEQKPSITGHYLTQNIDFEVTFSNNVNVGIANATIKGIGTYAGEQNKTFVINPATPTIEKLPNATDLKANSTLGESVISEGIVKGVGNDGKLTGQFAWKTPDHIVTESGEYTIVFTPTGVSEANYKPIETQVFVNVTKLSNVIPPVNIDHSSPPIDLENTNSDRGTGLSIRYVSGLDFGQKEFSFSEQKLSAKEEQAVNKETGTSETFENMITVEDGRGIRNGWVLTVRQYSEFNDGTVLEMNPNVDGRNGQGVLTGSNKLVLNGLSQTVAWAKNSESQMAGITSIGFGEVILTIPKGGGVGEKQNSLIWELIDGPAPP